MVNNKNSYLYKKRYLIISISSVLFILISWYIAVYYKFIPYLAPPQSVLSEFWKDARLILSHMLSTTSRALTGFAIGSITGILVALSMSWSRVILALVNPIILLMKPVPVLSLIPIFILWFGLGELGKILFISLGCFFIMVVISSEVIKNVDQTYIWAGQALGCSRGEIYRRIILPSIIPQIIGGLRVGINSAFPLSIAAEFLGAKKGLGIYLIKSSQYLILSKMIAAVIVIVILVIIFDRILREITKRITVWSERGE